MELEKLSSLKFDSGYTILYGTVLVQYFEDVYKLLKPLGDFMMMETILFMQKQLQKHMKTLDIKQIALFQLACFQIQLNT